MNEVKRQTTLIVVMFAILLMAAGGLTKDMFAKAEAAHQAAADLSQFRQVAGQIETLRKQDAIAATDEDADQQDQALAQRIDRAATVVGLTGEWRQEIQHKQARRVGDSPYLRKPAVLFTRGLTLAQITALLHELTYDSPLIVSELRLKTPRGEEAGNRWDADITLTYLIYSPQTSGQPGG